MSVTLSFHGGAGTVTGSRTLVSAGGRRVLVDCGLFQGRDLEPRNWEHPGFDPAAVDSVLLTHAHVDHTGWLPRLVNLGFRGQVLCTPATQELTHLLLLDSAHLQEEQAEWANRKGYTAHRPARPLYTVADAEAAAARLRPVHYGRPYAVAPDLTVAFHDAGHILGSAYVQITSGTTRVLFSGDIGNHDVPILRDPMRPPAAEAVVCESTYGDRLHKKGVDRRLELSEVLADTAKRGGVLVVPAFAVGRTQELLYELGMLLRSGAAPKLPVYVDSPLAVRATEVFRRHPECFDSEMRARLEKGDHPIDFAEVRLVRTREESIRLNELHRPAVILSASGMAEGGRVVHHLKARLPDERNTVAFVGYQGQGTRGRALVSGASSVRIFGEEVPVRARVVSLEGFSAHADQDGLLDWLSTFRDRLPARILLNHGEPEPAAALAAAAASRGLGKAVPVEHGQSYEV